MDSSSCSERETRGPRAWAWVRAAGLLALLALGAGCTGSRSWLVRPHQRAYLSDRIMRLDADRQAKAADQHVLATREGAFGGGGTAGGGCGCN